MHSTRPWYPQHLRERPDVVMALTRFANQLSGQYGVAVYLCGSALRNNNPSPRDWDLRLRLPDRDFAEWYGADGDHRKSSRQMEIVDEWITTGITGEWTAVRWRWSDDCVKQSRRGRRQTLLNIDCQIYPATHWDRAYLSLRRCRLDTRGTRDA